MQDVGGVPRVVGSGPTVEPMTGDRYHLAEKAQMKAVGFILCWIVVVVVSDH